MCVTWAIFDVFNILETERVRLAQRVWLLRPFLGIFTQQIVLLLLLLSKLTFRMEWANLLNTDREHFQGTKIIITNVNFFCHEKSRNAQRIYFYEVSQFPRIIVWIWRKFWTVHCSKFLLHLEVCACKKRIHKRFWFDLATLMVLC